MKYLSKMVTVQDVPNEISLSYLITGCPYRCKNCHTPEGWNAENGIELNLYHLKEDLEKYDGLLTCVLFLGGEWNEMELAILLKASKDAGLKTCVYIGGESVSDNLLKLIDYLKTGPYIEELGGLDNPNTNQKFIKVKTGEDLTHLFYKKQI